MAPGTRSKDPKTYILNFFYDDDDGSALTARINDHRFHIIVDPGKLRKTGGVANEVLQDYKRRLDALRQASAQSSQEESQDANTSGESKHDPDDGVVRCVCGATNDDEDLMTIACEDCGVWQHNACMGFTQDEEELDTAKYFCERCKPQRHSQLLAAKKRRRKPWEQKKKRALDEDGESGSEEPSSRNGDGADGDADSAVEVDDEDESQKHQRTSERMRSQDSGIDTSTDESELELDLQNWIMSCLGDEVQQIAPPQEEEAKSSVFDWYNSPVHFYELEVQDGALTPVETESTNQLQKRLDEFIPYIDAPKYIRDLGIPFVDPSTITVLETSDAIDPVHPSLVQYHGQEYFFKAVNPAEPGPSKREISLLHKAHQLKLHNKIKIPQIHHLVSASPGDKTSVMGFLMTTISSPTPLTKLMDSDVSETKRRKWAKESQRIIDVLHENDIIWGDAKGDNFIVDQNDELWIIDFGGSYTEGWVDRELAETQEGDEVGLEKVVNALDDPDGNTFDPDEEIASKSHHDGGRPGKRKTCENWEEDYEEEQRSKKVKR